MRAQQTPIATPEVYELGEDGWERWLAALAAEAYIEPRSSEADRIRNAIRAHKATVSLHRRKDD